MVTRLFLILLLFSGKNIYAQQNNCKVIKAELSGVYTGGCKNGLANGKGIAQAIDYYEGQFSRGMPEGNGTYKWANGTSYEGQWKKGLRDGEGKMVYSDSTVTGIWKEDKYIGKKLLRPYSIITSTSVARSTITKSGSKADAVKIRIIQGGNDNISIEDFTLAYDSGSEYRSGNYYGLDNVIFPVTIKIKYRSWNQLQTSQFNVIFEVIINQPGSWEVVLNN